MRRRIIACFGALMTILALADAPEQARKWVEGLSTARGVLPGAIEWVMTLLAGNFGRWTLAALAGGMTLWALHILERPTDWILDRLGHRNQHASPSIAASNGAVGVLNDKTGYSLSAGSFSVAAHRQSGIAKMQAKNYQMSVAISKVKPAEAQLSWEPRSTVYARVNNEGTAIDFWRHQPSGWFKSRFGRPDVLRFDLVEPAIRASN